MKFTIDVPESKLLFVNVPDNTKKYEIVYYGFAGTWLMQSNSESLNAWKTKIPNGNYEILGKITNQEYNFALRKL